MARQVITIKSKDEIKKERKDPERRLREAKDKFLAVDPNFSPYVPRKKK